MKNTKLVALATMLIGCVGWLSANAPVPADHGIRQIYTDDIVPPLCETLSKVCFILEEGGGNSDVDKLFTEFATVADIEGCLAGPPIVITQADMDAGGFTISAPGSYVLEGHLLAPIGPVNRAIRIEADGVELDFLGKSITQTNANVTVDGILIGTGRKNITIKNGALIDFSRNGIRSFNAARNIYRNLDCSDCNAP